MNTLAVRLCALVLVGSPLAAWAQFRTAPGPSGYQPPSQTQVVSQPVAQPVQNFSPWYPPWNVQTPMGSYLSGASDVINSQGNFLMAKRQSQVIQQQAEQAKIDTRKKSFEQWQWEQSQAPTLGDVRQKTYTASLERARNNPPQTEIWSGFALNTLLGAIQRNQAVSGIRGPTVPVDENVVKTINVTTGTTDTTQGSIGMLANGKLEWPLALADDRFSADRAAIDPLVADSVSQIRTAGRATADTVNSLRNAVTTMRSHLREQVAEIGSNDYVRALSFINALRDAIGQLSSPNAANYVNGTFQPRGATIGEIVEQMTQKGVRFAPATPGNENAYSALYLGFVAYDAGLSRLARR